MSKAAETFGDRLITLLKKKKLSQRKVSEALGISRTAVNKWTKGGMIDENNLDRLAQFLQVDKIWLKYGEYLSSEKEEPSLTLGRHINDFYLHESTEIVTWEWNIVTGEVFYSDNVEQVYGIPIRSNYDFLSLMNEESRDKMLLEYEKIIQQGGAHEIDFKIYQNGEYRWIRSRAAGIKGHNNKVTKIVGISLDNTERKKDEIALKQQKSFLSFLLKNQTVLTVFMDCKGEVLVSNCNDKKISFLKIQSYLYQLAMEKETALKEICEKGSGVIEFQGKRLALQAGRDYADRLFLMLQTDSDEFC